MRFCYNNRTNRFIKKNEKYHLIKYFSSNHFGVHAVYILIVPKLDRVKVVILIFYTGNLSLSEYSRCCQCPRLFSALIISIGTHWWFSTSRTCDILTDDFLWQLEQACIHGADQKRQRLMLILQSWPNDGLELVDKRPNFLTCFQRCGALIHVLCSLPEVSSGAHDHDLLINVLCINYFFFPIYLLHPPTAYLLGLILK